MRSLAVWTLFVLLYQTVIILTTGLLMYQCRLIPDAADNEGVNLLKLLYLYDPQECGRTVYYNYTRPLGDRREIHIVLWFQKNGIAQRFRHNIRISMYLQVIWTVLGLTYMSYSQRSWAFYTVLVPFTLAGLANLVFDVIHASYFIADSIHTQTEIDILKYINTTSTVYSLRPLDFPAELSAVYRLPPPRPPASTAWVSLIMAFFSVRGLLQWIANFWIVEDNYLEGVAIYRRLRVAKITEKVKKRKSTRPVV